MPRRAGLYVRDDRLCVLVPGGRRGGLQYFTIDAGEQPDARLKTELDGRRLKLRRIRLGLARPLVTVKTLELPRAGGARLQEMVPFELERHVPFPPEDMRFAFVPLPSGPKGPLRLLVMACERRIVERAVRLLDEARLKPVAITAACHDLRVLLRRKVRMRFVVWAHREGGTADLLFFAQGRLQLSRTVPVEDGEGLAAEVGATLGLLGWNECEAIWISGDEAAELIASPALEALSASVTEPPWSARAQKLMRALPAEGFGSAVLTLAAALGSRRPTLNLLPDELRPRTVSVGQVVTVGNLLVVASLAVALFLSQSYREQRYADRLSAAIRNLDPQVKQVERLSADLAQKRRLLETVQAIDKGEVHPLPILKELTDRLPQDAWLRTLSMDRQGIEITGQAAAANQLIPLLENSPSLAQVEFTAPVTKAGDKEQFRIKAAWKGPAKPPEPATAPAAKPGTTRPPRGTPPKLAPGGLPSR